MKFFFLTLALVLVTNTAFAADGQPGASVVMPITTKIVNLATMPVAEAIAFCNERNMACPAIRAKAQAQQNNISAAANNQ